MTPPTSSDKRCPTCGGIAYESDGHLYNERVTAPASHDSETCGFCRIGKPHTTPARLIAAAPSMYEALSAYVSAAETLISKITGPYEAEVATTYWNAKKAAQDALRLARGE